MRIGSGDSRVDVYHSHAVCAMLGAGGFDPVQVTFSGREALNTGNQGESADQDPGISAELYLSLLEGQIQLAVQAAESVPANLPEGVILLAVTRREDPRDVLISEDPEIDLENAAREFVIGVSTRSRAALMKHYAPKHRLIPVSESGESGIPELKSGKVDALVLSWTRVKALKFRTVVMKKLNAATFTPAAGQGTVAVLSVEGNSGWKEIRKNLNHEASEYSILCERAFLRTMSGRTRHPAFGLSTTIGDLLSFSGGLISENGSAIWRSEGNNSTIHAEDLGRQIAMEILTMTN